MKLSRNLADQQLHRKSIAVSSVAASLAPWNVTCALLRVSDDPALTIKAENMQVHIELPVPTF
jgi:hypothetical protein